MIIVKLILISIAIAIGLAILGFWLGFKVIQWKPAVGLPLVGGILALAAIGMASGG
jgi:hypothetical protein